VLEPIRQNDIENVTGFSENRTNNVRERAGQFQSSQITTQTSTGHFSGLFNAPIYGGTFNIYINDHKEMKDLPPPKRSRIILSDSDSVIIDFHSCVHVSYLICTKCVVRLLARKINVFIH